MELNEKPIQVGGGTIYVWSNPERTAKHIFLRRDPSFEQSPQAGVAIVADEQDRCLTVVELANLSRGIKGLVLEHGAGKTIYWASVMRSK